MKQCKNNTYKSVVLILVFLLLLSGCNNKSKYNFDDKIYIEERNDGWYYVSNIAIGKENSEYYFYEYDAYNLKYKNIDGYYIRIYDKNTGEEIESATTVLPYLSLLPEAGADVKKISTYFKEKRYMDEIEYSDLNDLELDYIDKNDLLYMFNRAIAQDYMVEGRYPNIPVFNMEQSHMLNKYKWQAAYICSHGRICAFNIELIYESNQEEIYLSDLVNSNSATNEQKELFEVIQKIENKILNSDDFLAWNVNDYSYIEDVDFDVLYSTINKFNIEE